MKALSIARCAFLGLLAGGLESTGPLDAQSPPAASAKPTIVLVHGAFADGSSWSHVIPLLLRDGYPVIAVQMPLASLAGDVETTKRVIDAQQGPVIVVGHSYGGAVITEAAAGNPNVKGLVYIAAFAPDANEPIGAFGEKYPTELGTAFKPDAAGFLYVDRARFRELFAADVPTAETSILAVTQKPIIGSVFGASVSQAAWKTIPAWYLVAQNDKAINPDLERFYAQRMKATTVEVASSHVPFVSHPDVVVKLIEQAASGVR
jgi:pimeloyl-ACP methyl ester carboxylesterase